LLPGALLVGKVDLWILVLAVLILIISVMAMFAFVAKVYESLILHNGKRIRMKELFTIFKNSGKEASAENE
jgi:ABC-2 type transport system permease protein